VVRWQNIQPALKSGLLTVGALEEWTNISRNFPQELKTGFGILETSIGG
jgi:hypothetical protein